MTTFLYNGWMLTGISVSVVFAALIILFIVYSLIGKIVAYSERPARKKSVKAEKSGSIDELTAAAIAMALEAEMSSNVHDYESGIITIRHNRQYGQS